jgi:hypothetical protein
MTMRDKAGFTFWELLLAAGITLVAIAALLLALTYCIFLNEFNNNLITAANDAQYVLEQIRASPYEQIAAYSPPVFNNLENENVSVSKSLGTRIAEVAVNVSWTQRRRQENFRLSTRIAK